MRRITEGQAAFMFVVAMCVLVVLGFAIFGCAGMFKLRCQELTIGSQADGGGDSSGK